MTIADKLKATRLLYTFTDESGYKFTVAADLTDDRGWTASVTLTVRGLRDAESAVRYLSEPARQFLRMLAEVEAAEAGKGGV